MWEYERDGMIPPFFTQSWAEKHPNEPLPLARMERKKKQEKISSFLLIAGVSCIVLAIIYLILLFSDAFGKTESLSYWWLTPTIAGIVIGFSVMLSSSIFEKEDPLLNEYYSDLTNFFIFFDIEQGEEVGRLSREEFRKHTETSLCQQAEKSCSVGVVGFNGVKERRKFANMHESALRWGLCRENWIHYFPREEKIGA